MEVTELGTIKTGVAGETTSVAKTPQKRNTIGKREIISRFAMKKAVEQLISKVKNEEQAENLQDLAQEIYLALLEKDDALIQGLYERNELDYFVTRMIINNIHSKTSRYHYKFRRPFEHDEITKYDYEYQGIIR